MTEVNELIKQHYVIERELAQQILASSPEHRTRTAIDAYNELYSRIPWHPLLQSSEKSEQETLAEKWMLYGYMVSPTSAILDIGAGAAK